ncbi:MAG TPA: DMT family transporter [Baekduia sp.]|nr:DMT family transporter [Baekduia sp.]
MAVVFALAASLAWGTSDFLAGMASRRVPVVWVLLLGELGGLAVIGLVAAIARPAFFASASDVLLAMGAGASGVVALGCFYRALAIGTMSVVAPISATGAALPVLAGIVMGDRLSAVVVIGLVVTVAGVALASREVHDDEESARAGRSGIALAAVAAVGFGGFFVLSHHPAEASVVWTLVLVRAAPLPVVAAIALRGAPLRAGRGMTLGVAAIGTIDLAAITLVAVASTRGELGVVAVLGSMYPVVTVLLAAAFLGERVRPPQLAGVVLALGGVAAVAAG